MKRRSLVHLRFSPNTSAMFSHNSFDSRQSDAGPFEFVSAMKTLEDAEKLFGKSHVETHAIVAHFEDGFLALLTAPDLNDRRFPRPRIFKRVAQKVSEDQLHQSRITVHCAQRSDLPLDMPIFGFVLQVQNGFRYE